MKIVIQPLPHALQRYDTVGDWQFAPRGNLLSVRVSRMRDERAEWAVALHEMVEALLCNAAGVSQEEVDRFDFGFLGEGEPGDDPAAPYAAQHTIATEIERRFVEALGLRWEDYEATVQRAGEEG